MNSTKILLILFLTISIIGITNAQTEVNPRDIKFDVNTKLEFNSPHLDIINHATSGGSLFQPFVQGNIRYISSGHHIFYGATTSTPLMSLSYDSARAEGEINRPSTGNSDLLPYAYGNVCQASNVTLFKEKDTDNFTVSQGSGYIDINLNENVANDVFLIGSPSDCSEFGGASQLRSKTIDANTIRVQLYNPDGSPAGADKGLTFVIYRK